MNTDDCKLKLDNISECIIGCAYKISNGLGSGFMEKVYENALAYEIGKAGLRVEQQYKLKVRYKDIIVGEYIADLLVENQLLVELKTVKAFDNNHIAQCLNYLKATKLKICLLIKSASICVHLRLINGITFTKCFILIKRNIQS